MFGGLSLESGRGPLGGAATQRRRLSVLAILALARDGGLTRDTLYALERDSRADVPVLGYDRLTLSRKGAPE
jgi:hypothetical protein